VSNDHRRRQVTKGTVARSRDRWRPPDQKRERGPAGDQASRVSEARRLRQQRYASRIWLGDRALFELVDLNNERMLPHAVAGGRR
jgi:hypothetical protein